MITQHEEEGCMVAAVTIGKAADLLGQAPAEALDGEHEHFSEDEVDGAPGGDHLQIELLGHDADAAEDVFGVDEGAYAAREHAVLDGGAKEAQRRGGAGLLRAQA
jgi:hypothetical protein